MENTNNAIPERTLDEFESAIIRYRSGEESINKVYAYAMPVFARLSRSAAFRMGIPEEGQEIAQELGLKFFQEIIHEYNPEYSIYPFLRTYAGNLARTHSRLKMLTPNATDLLSSNDADGESDPVRDYGVLIAGLDGHEADDATESVISRLDRAAALQKIGQSLYPPASSRPGGGFRKDGTLRAKLPDVGFFVQKSSEKPLRRPKVQRPPVVWSPATAESGGDTRWESANADQIELRSIRLSLGMSQPEFAGEIGIKVPRLSSYEYGKTIGVPEHIMEAARKLQKDAAARNALQALYGNKTMAEIFNGWAEQITEALRASSELAPDVRVVADSYIARLLQVTETTIRRWRSNRARPSLNVINAHNESVSFFVTQCKLKAEGSKSIRSKNQGIKA